MLNFQFVFGRHNIRPPHFASKVSYSASPQAFAAILCPVLLPFLLFCAGKSLCGEEKNVADNPFPILDGERRPTFDRVSSHVRSCLVPRSLKSSKMEGQRITLGCSRYNINIGVASPSQRRFALHNRLLRRQHCSSLCSQSEGHEHVANMTSAQEHIFVEFPVRVWSPQYSSPHFASKVSYSASPQAFAA